MELAFDEAGRQPPRLVVAIIEGFHGGIPLKGLHRHEIDPVLGEIDPSLVFVPIMHFRPSTLSLQNVDTICIAVNPVLLQREAACSVHPTRDLTSGTDESRSNHLARWYTGDSAGAPNEAFRREAGASV